MTDQDVLHFTPAVSPDKARKMISAAQWNALLGDAGADALFFEAIFDEVNALSRVRFGELADGPDNAYGLIFSTQELLGEGYEDPVSDGSPWFLAEPGSSEPVEVFLDEEEIQIGLDTTSGLDINAAALAADGSIYLSFRNDELIHGVAVLLENGGVVAFDAASISYDVDGCVDDIVAGSAVVILDEAAVDAMITQAGITDADSTPIQTADNLIALEIDPAGGTPSGTAYLLVALGGTLAGTTYPALEVPGSLGLTGQYAAPLANPIVGMTLDANGDLEIPILIPGSIVVDVNAVIQWVDAGPSRQLPAPIVIAFDADGP